MRGYDDHMFFDHVEMVREQYRAYMDEVMDFYDPGAYSWQQWAEHWADRKREEEDGQA